MFQGVNSWHDEVRKKFSWCPSSSRNTSALHHIIGLYLVLEAREGENKKVTLTVIESFPHSPEHVASDDCRATASQRCPGEGQKQPPVHQQAKEGPKILVGAYRVYLRAGKVRALFPAAQTTFLF